MKDTIFKLLDEHFEIDMLMNPDPVKKENERHYGDDYLYIIFSWSDINALRVVIRNWKTKITFSKTSIIPDTKITTREADKSSIAFGQSARSTRPGSVSPAPRPSD